MKIVVDKKKIAHELAGLFPLLHRKLLRPICQMEKCILTPLQFIAMMWIYDHEANTMTELADKLDIAKQQMTPIIDKLVSLGFVERSQEAADRRIIKLSATPGGVGFLCSHQLRVGESLDERLSSLSLEELEKLERAVADLSAICEKMI